MNNELKEKIKAFELHFSVEVNINCVMPVTYNMTKKAMDEDWKTVKQWQTEENHDNADYMTWSESDCNQKFLDNLNFELGDWMDYDSFNDYLCGLEKEELLKLIKIKIDKKDLLKQAVDHFNRVPDYEFALIEK